MTKCTYKSDCKNKAIKFFIGPGFAANVNEEYHAYCEYHWYFTIVDLKLNPPTISEEEYEIHTVLNK